MPAPNSQQVGVDFLLLVAGIVLEGQQGGTLDRPTNLVDVTSKTSGRYQESVAAQREWSLSFDGNFIDPNGNDQTGAGAKLEIQTGTTASPAWEALAARTSLSLGLSMDVIDISSADSAPWRAIKPGTRSWTISADMGYIDPEGSNGAALKAFLDAKAAGEPADIRLTVPSGGTFTGLVNVENAPLEVPRDGKASTTLDLTGTGTLTNGLTAGRSGLDALLTAYFSDPAGTVQALMEVRDASDTAIVGATKHEGTAYLTDLSIDLPFDDRAALSGTLDGTGPLADAAQA